MWNLFSCFSKGIAVRNRAAQHFAYVLYPLTLSLAVTAFCIGCGPSAGTLEKANRLAATDNWKGACGLFERLVKSGSTERDAYRGLATAYERLDRRPEAVQVLEDWLLIDPTDGAVHLGLGIWAYEAGRLDDAGSHLLTAWQHAEYKDDRDKAAVWLNRLR